MTIGGFYTLSQTRATVFHVPGWLNSIMPHPPALASGTSEALGCGCLKPSLVNRELGAMRYLGKRHARSWADRFSES